MSNKSRPIKMILQPGEYDPNRRAGDSPYVESIRKDMEKELQRIGRMFTHEYLPYLKKQNSV